MKELTVIAPQTNNSKSDQSFSSGQDTSHATTSLSPAEVFFATENTQNGNDFFRNDVISAFFQNAVDHQNVMWYRASDVMISVLQKSSTKGLRFFFFEERKDNGNDVIQDGGMFFKNGHTSEEPQSPDVVNHTESPAHGSENVFSSEMTPTGNDTVFFFFENTEAKTEFDKWQESKTAADGDPGSAPFGCKVFFTTELTPNSEFFQKEFANFSFGNSVTALNGNDSSPTKLFFAAVFKDNDACNGNEGHCEGHCLGH